jgi:hypothetical protein
MGSVTLQLILRAVAAHRLEATKVPTHHSLQNAINLLWIQYWKYMCLCVCACKTGQLTVQSGLLFMWLWDFSVISHNLPVYKPANSIWEFLFQSLINEEWLRGNQKWPPQCVKIVRNWNCVKIKCVHTVLMRTQCIETANYNAFVNLELVK